MAKIQLAKNGKTGEMCPVCGSDDPKVRFVGRIGACDRTCTHYWHNGLPDRFQFVQDDSCHWYAIPAGKRDEFERWVESFSDEKYEAAYGGPDFSDYRIDGYPGFYTFTDLKRDGQ